MAPDPSLTISIYLTTVS